MDKITIGIPKALLYYHYSPLWLSFFKELGIFTTVSEKSNMEMLNLGSNLCIDEACLSMKIFMGHVLSLKGRCNYILIPRLIHIEKHEKLCTNFSALYDLVKTLIPDINIINYNIDVEKHDSELLAFTKMGVELGFSHLESIKAYKKAKNQLEAEYHLKQIKQNQLLENQNLKILLVGHPYNIYDELIGKPLVKFLNELDVTIIDAGIYPKDNTDTLAKAISKSNYWTYNKELLAGINYYRKGVDGIILLTTFPCGPDSLSNEIILRKVKNVPVISIIVDEVNALEGIKTRLESFVDIIKQRKEVSSR